MITLKSEILTIISRKYKTSAACMKNAKVGDRIQITKEMVKPYRGINGLNASKYILENLSNSEKHTVTETILINTLESFNLI